MCHLTNNLEVTEKESDNPYLKLHMMRIAISSELLPCFRQRSTPSSLNFQLRNGESFVWWITILSTRMMNFQWRSLPLASNIVWSKESPDSPELKKIIASYYCRDNIEHYMTDSIQKRLITNAAYIYLYVCYYAWKLLYLNAGSGTARDRTPQMCHPGKLIYKQTPWKEGITVYEHTSHLIHPTLKLEPL